MKVLVTLISALTLTVFLTSCQPHPFPFHSGQMMGRVADRVKNELSLTDDQNAKLQDLVTAVKARWDDQTSSNDPWKKQVEDLISAPQLDTAKVRALIQERRDALLKNFDASLDVLLPKVAAFHDSLSDQQRKKVVDFMEQIHRGWGPNF